MDKIIHWGILGTGTIARKFAEGLQFVPEAQLVAVASRSQAGADAFEQQFVVPHRYASYEALMHDPIVDAVYIATPHSCHKDNTILCLAAGKPVLCEKPFTINAQDAEAIINIARAKKILLMEAMWTRFLPVMVRLRKMLSQGVIGEPRLLAADFGFHKDFDAESRLFRPELGGGALLDVGVYAVSLASMIFGPPSRLTGLAHFGESGVDEQSAVTLAYDKGQLANLYSSIRTATFQEATLMGTKGRIKINSPWWKATTLTLMRDNDKDDLLELPFEGNGYQYQAAEFMRLLREKKTESEIMPLDESLAIMKTMDAVRKLWGLKYPMEN
jgi:predicted dehydrogenase